MPIVAANRTSTEDVFFFFPKASATSSSEPQLEETQGLIAVPVGRRRRWGWRRWGLTSCRTSKSHGSSTDVLYSSVLYSFISSPRSSTNPFSTPSPLLLNFQLLCLLLPSSTPTSTLCCSLSLSRVLAWTRAIVAGQQAAVRYISQSFLSHNSRCLPSSGFYYRQRRSNLFIYSLLKLHHD